MNEIINDHPKLLELTAEIVAAHVSNNHVPATDVPAAIETVFQTISSLNTAYVAEEEPLVPAVPIKRSVKDDHIICLEDGKKLKMLKRHLRIAFDMTPEEYRAKWGLPFDYPMVAPAYARKRQELAKKFGLGRKPKVKSRRKKK